MEPEVHTPQPIVYVTPGPPLPALRPEAPVTPQLGGAHTVQTVLLPNGQVVTGYAMTQPPAAAELAPARVSPLAVNVALGGVGFLAVCGGLILLTSFIAALAALVQQLIILAAVIFGGWIAAQVLRSDRGSGGVTINAKKAVFKRNTFRS